jgi:CBS domain-containing protein
MRVEEIMTTDPSTVTPETPINEAALIMKDQNVGMLPVVEAEGSAKLVGVITDRDIAIRHVAEGHNTNTCPVSEAMTEAVTTCRPGDDVQDIMSLMGKEQVRRIPIVDERGSLLGVVAQADVARFGDDRAAGATVEKISQPYGNHAE